jgi:hypothetical protein
VKIVTAEKLKSAEIAKEMCGKYDDKDGHQAQSFGDHLDRSPHGSKAAIPECYGEHEKHEDTEPGERELPTEIHDGAREWFGRSRD